MADGNFNRLTDAPPGKGAGMQQGVLLDDPATGNFLLLSAGELWELALRVPAPGALSEARACRRQG